MPLFGHRKGHTADAEAKGAPKTNTSADFGQIQAELERLMASPPDLAAQLMPALVRSVGPGSAPSILMSTLEARLSYGAGAGHRQCVVGDNPYRRTTSSSQPYFFASSANSADS